MKKLVFALFAAVALSANAQDLPVHKAHIKGTIISAPSRNRPRPVVNVERNQVQGILPRAARIDNPLQMLNPLAPREYGNGSEIVSGYDDDPGHGPKNQKNNGVGLKLFSFEF